MQKQPALQLLFEPAAACIHSRCEQHWFNGLIRLRFPVFSFSTVTYWEGDQISVFRNKFKNKLDKLTLIFPWNFVGSSSDDAAVVFSLISSHHLRMCCFLFPPLFVFFFFFFLNCLFIYVFIVLRETKGALQEPVFYFIILSPFCIQGRLTLKMQWVQLYGAWLPVCLRIQGSPL